MSNLVKISKLYSIGFNNMAISRQVKRELLGNVGYGFYTQNPIFLKLENDMTMIKINNLLDKYPLTPKRMVFSSISLNFCINQLISSTTYIVEVEKEYVQSVFYYLKEKLSNNILIKPNKQEKENYWVPNTIYVKELYKRSPVNKDGTIKIEKLLVDLLFDEDVYSLFSGKDINNAIDILCSNFTINYKTLIAYATRRNKRSELIDRIYSYIPKEIIEELMNDR